MYSQYKPKHHHVYFKLGGSKKTTQNLNYIHRLNSPPFLARLTQIMKLIINQHKHIHACIQND